MTSPVRESEREARSRVHRGVRRRALDMLLHCFADSVGADTAILVARAQNARTHVLATWTRGEREPAVAWTSGSLVGRAFDSGEPLVEPAGNGDGALYAAVAAPVRSAERVVGVLYATFEPCSGETADRLMWTAKSYARMAALCTSDDDLSLPAALGSVSFDPLTGCLSYGGVIDVLASELPRSQRRGHTLSACMIDLDGFKRVNDERGHVEGNRVLQAVGDALRATARRYDAVGRFGGDEYVVVLPETGGRAVEHVGRRFLATVRAATAATTSIPLDASIGIVEWNGEETSVELIETAGGAMRAAKQSGGGRIVCQARGGGSEGLAALTDQLTAPFRAKGREAPAGNREALSETAKGAA